VQTENGLKIISAMAFALPWNENQVLVLFMKNIWSVHCTAGLHVCILCGK